MWGVLLLFVFTGRWFVDLLDLLLRWAVCYVLACIGFLWDLVVWLAVVASCLGGLRGLVSCGLRVVCC